MPMGVVIAQSSRSPPTTAIAENRNANTSGHSIRRRCLMMGGALENWKKTE